MCMFECFYVIGVIIVYKCNEVFVFKCSYYKFLRKNKVRSYLEVLCSGL